MLHLSLAPPNVKVLALADVALVVALREWSGEPLFWLPVVVKLYSVEVYVAYSGIGVIEAASRDGYASDDDIFRNGKAKVLERISGTVAPNAPVVHVRYTPVVFAVDRSCPPVRATPPSVVATGKLVALFT